MANDMTRDDLTDGPSVPRRPGEYVNTNPAIAATDRHLPSVTRTGTSNGTRHG